MKRYTTYKDSGIEWLGEVPCEWGTKKLKFFSQIVLGKMLTNEDKGGYFYKPYLRAQNLNWFSVNYEDIKLMWFSENELSQYRIKKDDLLVSEGGEVGRTCMWNNEIEECYIQNSVHKVTVHEGNIPKFFQYFFFTLGAIGHFNAIVSRVSIAHLTREKLKEVYFFVPERKQQAIITTFLDHKTQQIDILIAKQQKLIELLKEERTALVNHAVTKGLDSTVLMKDSGIEWLAKIPEHWELRKIGRSFKIIGSGTTPTAGREEYYQDGNIPWVLTGDLNDNYLSQTSKSVTEKAFAEHSALKKFPAGSLVIALYGATIGRLSILEIEATTNQACCVLADSKFFLIRFLFYWFLSNRDNIISLSYGGGQPNISQEIIRSIKVPCPTIKEQNAIIKFIDNKCNAIDNSITHIEKETELISEYRTSLIREAVTGKIDVRDYIFNPTTFIS